MNIPSLMSVLILRFCLASLLITLNPGHSMFSFVDYTHLVGVHGTLTIGVILLMILIVVLVLLVKRKTEILPFNV
jgi:uncharacterized membrane protein